VRTGGDGSNTFNISTAAAIRCSRGGRARLRSMGIGGQFAERLCGRTGALGVRIDLPFERYGRAIRRLASGFLLRAIGAHGRRPAIAAALDIQLGANRV